LWKNVHFQEEEKKVFSSFLSFFNESRITASSFLVYFRCETSHFEKVDPNWWIKIRKKYLGYAQMQKQIHKTISLIKIIEKKSFFSRNVKNRKNSFFTTKKVCTH
jgi:hypothetical protein